MAEPALAGVRIVAVTLPGHGGAAAFRATLRLIGPAFKGALPPDRHAALVAERRRSDPHDVRRSAHLYLHYLDEHGTVAPRLCSAGVPTWVVYGEHDDAGIADEERRTLEQRGASVVTIPGAGHFTPNQEPRPVAELVAELVATALAAVRRGAGGRRPTAAEQP
jgi:pimeloyl-ACP methyl ester carboxylesterase